MNKLSPLGSEILNHKVEYNKDYSDLIKNALVSALVVRLKDDAYNEISEDFQNIKVDVENFKLVLLSMGVPFSKTQEELLEEFKVLRDEMLVLITDKTIPCEIDMKREAFIFKKNFDFDADFFMEYFGVKEKDITNHMKEKSFIHIFANYRLPSILKNIIESLEHDGDKYTIDASPIYFDKKLNAYGIELNVFLDIESALELKENDDMEQLFEAINKTREYVVEEFNKRMLI